MQDRYAGDVGDFQKLGLLRHLGRAAGLIIGVNWYRAPDEAHNADGKHTKYLQPSNRWHAALASCDPDLMRELAVVVETQRSVQELERSGALPDGPTYSAILDARTDRAAWHRGAVVGLADAAAIFCDPDNGLCSREKMPKLYKYALVRELADYAARGQSLVAYQHADRSKGTSAETQAKQRLEQLAAGVSQAPVGAVIAHRGSCRFFLVSAAESHWDRLSGALDSFAAKWWEHVDLIRPA